MFSSILWLSTGLTFVSALSIPGIQLHFDFKEESSSISSISPSVPSTDHHISLDGPVNTLLSPFTLLISASKGSQPYSLVYEGLYVNGHLRTGQPGESPKRFTLSDGILYTEEKDAGVSYHVSAALERTFPPMVALFSPEFPDIKFFIDNDGGNKILRAKDSYQSLSLLADGPGQRVWSYGDKPAYVVVQ